ncbi:bifunctional alpha,alpha-trehalose-phosphate synthase (UDP-forming)/trehalose-phosphatase [Marinifilum caeruleilacunae]|uniref:Bifunctional alpha,alpha-trehalose-phosphate synthase (UDP-forming)/trehalose-phosphatase n=1 Tax=Marinifilum caeruleilacunae TaxID=2499076 RepID=A0ABX1WZD7_9BACT|nr:bifunctional alpha,alpha-trehalose-phosphate synthase (UDP-forming)/trehalose-phosphatase [Marinifilum caeruleilacunae]NOU61530.1 bifunctional alpha,alpha-trehalose-phosphate synthase (UDP-forming)/trehalose-phosphatase [Marinifilum caeruleilacunae]
MNRIHIVSNRLPVSINVENDHIELVPSVGGLATGMRSVYKEYNGKWIGWPGLPSDDLNEELQSNIDEKLIEEDCVSVHLSKEEIDLYYDGFSNRTIWPLFHYFAQYIDYSPELWDAFVSVNQKFADKALETLEEGDTIWIHDYQLLLVPEMIKSQKPGVTVGFFLHIPFPSFEVFRILPWRKELIQGMLGADLIGFHTFDYQRHFFSCVRRLMGYEISFNEIHIEDRIVIVDSFPMGIDYDKFRDAAIQTFQKPLQEKSKLHRELEKYFLVSPNRKLILSIDRLDYSKGIPNRLQAFAKFLEEYPEFIGKVTLIMLAVPSRGTVEHYINLKREVDELVGNVNGRFGSINYTPVWYFYRSLPFENLIELYSSCDVALVTPVRDGMNLVAKEYVASRTNRTGVIILSEMAGVSKEMGEALMINPNNTGEIAQSIYQALTMPLEEQRERMIYLQDRIKRYDVFKWSSEFVKSLRKVEKLQSSIYAKKVNTSILEKIKTEYANSQKRSIFLDYDGTLTGFKKNPNDAKPDEELHKILYQLEEDPKNVITIISGRDRESLENWFDGHKINLIVEHGVWIKKYNKEWKMLANANDTWKPSIRPILETFVDRTPGSFIEEKNYSLVWHFRKSEPEQGELRANELKDELTTMIANHNLEILEGNKVIEVKSGGINKGMASLQFLQNQNFDFILALGDDWTDEYMFRELPDTAITIKVGLKHTAARYKVDSVSKVRSLLSNLE